MSHFSSSAAAVMFSFFDTSCRLIGSVSSRFLRSQGFQGLGPQPYLHTMIDLVSSLFLFWLTSSNTRSFSSSFNYAGDLGWKMGRWIHETMNTAWHGNGIGKWYAPASGWAWELAPDTGHKLRLIHSHGAIKVGQDLEKREKEEKERDGRHAERA